MLKRQEEVARKETNRIYGNARELVLARPGAVPTAAECVTSRTAARQRLFAEADVEVRGLRHARRDISVVSGIRFRACCGRDICHCGWQVSVGVEPVREPARAILYVSAL